ncbi:Hypothetical protein, putative [Bodo saltans]|uniref:Uncharacterized protein n=1 Tax=Bodo saltans TaxID=75058 RepID=A0A0S4KKR0_BODSA|nr:Hypothetical protein, putative [Bodo saltans]|eukprot:CUI15043.1 Hypothetical protein, putative [Bodo saltans]
MLVRVKLRAAHPSDSHRQFQHLQRFFGDHGISEQNQGDKTSLSSELKKVTILCCQYLPTAPLPASFTIVHGLLFQPTMGAVACVVTSGRGAVSIVLTISMPCVNDSCARTSTCMTSQESLSFSSVFPKRPSPHIFLLPPQDRGSE